MKIFDCVPFFDEEMMLDLRFNILDQYVDKFIVVEQSYTHSGRKKKQNFDICKYKKFKDKIIYFFLEEEPENLHTIDKNNESHAGLERINSLKRIEFQYNKIMDGLVSADLEDLIIVGDCDEIPNLTDLNLKTINNNIILFKQRLYYYKFNLLYKNFNWFGNKACKKKNLVSMDWLKYVKNKKYPFWRLDTLFSKKKYINVKIVNNGGWHFTNVKTNKEIYYKLMNYGEHNEFERSGLTENDIQNLINKKKVYFNHEADKTSTNKYSSNIDLHYEANENLPKYLIDNRHIYKNWFI